MVSSAGDAREGEGTRERGAVEEREGSGRDERGGAARWRNARAAAARVSPARGSPPRARAQCAPSGRAVGGADQSMSGDEGGGFGDRIDLERLNAPQLLQPWGSSTAYPRSACLRPRQRARSQWPCQLPCRAARGHRRVARGCRWRRGIACVGDSARRHARTVVGDRADAMTVTRSRAAPAPSPRRGSNTQTCEGSGRREPPRCARCRHASRRCSGSRCPASEAGARRPHGP